MGFEINGGAAVLEFGENTVLHGATVRCVTGLTLRKFIGLQQALAGVAVSDIDASEIAFREFGDLVLHSWDIERDGVPMEATGESLITLPMAAVNQIIIAWSEVMMGTSPNSSAASPSGDMSAAQ